jgi:hypothetical protein
MNEKRPEAVGYRVKLKTGVLHITDSMFPLPLGEGEG